MNSTTVQWAVLALDEISQWWTELEDDLEPGTRRRWNQRDLTPEEAERRADLARRERADRAENQRRGIEPWERTASPLVDGVLEVKADVEVALGELYREVHEQVDHTDTTAVPLPSVRDGRLGERRWYTPIPRPVPVMARWLADTLIAAGVDDDLAEHVGAEARRMCAAMRTATGRQEPEMRLNANCPECDAPSLRALPLRETARCVNPACARVWAGKEQLAWLSRLIGGDVDAVSA